MEKSQGQLPNRGMRGGQGVADAYIRTQRATRDCMQVGAGDDERGTS